MNTKISWEIKALIVGAVAMITILIGLKKINSEEVASYTPPFPQATDLFQEYSANKVAFDMENKDNQFEFEGEIAEISNDDDCSEVSIKIYDRSFDRIVCKNCPSRVDKWIDEVTTLTVGQLVRIKGTYSSSMSNSYEMKFYQCHIIN